MENIPQVCLHYQRYMKINYMPKYWNSLTYFLKFKLYLNKWLEKRSYLEKSEGGIKLFQGPKNFHPLTLENGNLAGVWLALYSKEGENKFDAVQNLEKQTHL